MTIPDPTEPVACGLAVIMALLIAVVVAIDIKGGG